MTPDNRIGKVVINFTSFLMFRNYLKLSLEHASFSHKKAGLAGVLIVLAQ